VGQRGSMDRRCRIESEVHLFDMYTIRRESAGFW
jgi:hypothetical protein